MSFSRWMIVVYLLAMMGIAFSIVTIPGNQYQILTTSDSGWVYDEAMVIENTNGLAENNPWSHAPYGLSFESTQLQPLTAVMIYRGLHTILPSISLMDVVKYFAPFLFCLSLIPVYLAAREFGGRTAGIFAVFFMATMTSTIYWHKVGAFDREPTITLFAAWSFYCLVRLFKSNRKNLWVNSLLTGLVMGLFFFGWSGALYISSVMVLGLILVLLVGFGGKLMQKFDDVYGAIFHSIRNHWVFLTGCVVSLVVTTIAYSGIAGVSPNFWVGFSTTMLRYLGIPMGGDTGVSFSRYAKEMQAPSSWEDVIEPFYQNELLTYLVLLGVGIALMMCLWKRQRHHLLLIATLAVLMALVWPGKGQARFERIWWPFVPVIAGFGMATVLSWLRSLSLDPNWEWLKGFQHPLLLVTVVVFLSAAFLTNAYAAAELVTSPPEWHGRGLDPALMEAFDWIKQNTSENETISIQWSFGHLLTGATQRMAVVDGAEIKGEKGVWENDPNFTPRPPDYIYYVKNGNGYIYGVDEGGRSYTINGRRPDVQWFPYAPENELRWYLKTYRDEFGVRIDYLLFTCDEIYNAEYYYQYWEPGPILLSAQELRKTSNISFEGNNIILNFGSGRERVVVDYQSRKAYLDSNDSQEEMDGFAILSYNPDWNLIGGRHFDYYTRFYSSSSPSINETVLVFIDQNGRVTSASLVSGVSNQVSNRELPIPLRADVQTVDFLDEVFTSSNGFVKIYKVNHSVIT